LVQANALSTLPHAGVELPSHSSSPPGSQALHAHLLKMHDLHNQVYASTQAQASAVAMLPHAAADVPNRQGSAGGVEEGLSIHADCSATPPLLQQLLSLQKMREGRARLEHQHALMLQLEEAHEQEIVKQRSIEMPRNILYGNRKLDESRQAPKAGLPNTRSNPKGSKEENDTKRTLPSIGTTRNSSFAPLRKTPSTSVEKKAKVLMQIPPEDPKKLKKNDSKWRGMLEVLKDYKTTHGDCIVPRGYSEHPQLASWVSSTVRMLSKGRDRQNAHFSCPLPHLTGSGTAKAVQAIIRQQAMFDHPGAHRSPERTRLRVECSRSSMGSTWKTSSAFAKKRGTVTCQWTTPSIPSSASGSRNSAATIL
jgi:Helicase associated domain